MSLRKTVQVSVFIKCSNWKHSVMISDNLITLLSLVGFFIGFAMISAIIAYVLCKKSKRNINQYEKDDTKNQSIPSENKENDFINQENQQFNKIRDDIDAKINKEKSMSIQVQASIINANKNTISEFDCSLKLDSKSGNIVEDEKNDIFEELMPREDKLEVNQILDLGTQSFTSLMADLRQDITEFLHLAGALIEHFLSRNCSVKTLVH